MCVSYISARCQDPHRLPPSIEPHLYKPIKGQIEQEFIRRKVEASTSKRAVDAFAQRSSFKANFIQKESLPLTLLLKDDDNVCKNATYRDIDRTITDSSSLSSKDSDYSGPLKQSCRRKVRFDVVEIYVHNMELGDNPAVSHGPPLCLGKKLLRKDLLTVDIYEANSPYHRRSNELRISRNERERILKNAGYSHSEVLQVSILMDRIKIRRECSARGGCITQIRRLFGMEKVKCNQREQRSSE